MNGQKSKSFFYNHHYRQSINGTRPVPLYTAAKNCKHFLQRLTLENKLNVHGGCVNTICWNSTGENLLSASDDLYLCITNAFTSEVKAKIRTAHLTNIFSAKYMPDTNDTKVVSCSGDGVIIYTDLNRPDSATTNIFDCQSESVYDIITVPNDSHTFLTCSHDRTVRWYDLRIKTSCLKNPYYSRLSLRRMHSRCVDDVLIRCEHPVTALAINHLLPYQLAIGCSDSIVRIYDRRMLSTVSLGGFNKDQDQQSIVYKFVYDKMSKKNRITSLAYSRDAEKLLASYSNDHLYLYDMYGVKETVERGNDEDVLALNYNQNDSCPFKRFRLRGDWSDTGPETLARGEQEPSRFRARQASETAPIPVSDAAAATSSASVQPAAAAAAASSSSFSPSLLFMAAAAIRSGRVLSSSPSSSPQSQSSSSSSTMFSLLTANDFLVSTTNQSTPTTSTATTSSSPMIQSTSAVSSTPVSSASSALPFPSDPPSPIHSVTDSSWDAEMFQSPGNEERTDEEGRDLSAILEVDTDMELDSDSTVDSVFNNNNNDNDSTLSGMANSDHNVSNADVSPAFQNFYNHLIPPPPPPPTTSRLRADLYSRFAEVRDRVLQSHDELTKSNCTKRLKTYKVKSYRVFKGHRNSRTVIKEATFWGDEYVVSGSDCGHIFFWSIQTGELVMYMVADQHVVNCLQPHPTHPILASSGIDYDIKVWAPKGEQSCFNQNKANTIVDRNTNIMNDTRETVTVPARFVLSLFTSISQRYNRPPSPGNHRASAEAPAPAPPVFDPMDEPSFDYDVSFDLGDD